MSMSKNLDSSDIESKTSKSGTKSETKSDTNKNFKNIFDILRETKIFDIFEEIKKNGKQCLVKFQ